MDDSSNGIERPRRKVIVSRQQLPGRAVRMARFVRGAGLRLLDPLDYLLRIMNGKQDLPSLTLRRYVGPLSSFETSGAEFVAYLKLIANLASYESILDVGCGCGLIALGLRSYLSKEGRYLGLDIHQPSINWCQRAIQAKYPHFAFELIDVHNATYNPAGKHRAENYAFPIADASFDVVLLKSVFTHMRPAEVENYLREIARVLKPNGRCLATLFLFDADPTQEAKNGSTNLTFQFGAGDWRYEYRNSPDSAIAYSQRFTLNTLTTQGLRLNRLLSGTWRNQQHGISYQDILLIEKSQP